MMKRLLIALIFSLAISEGHSQTLVVLDSTLVHVEVVIDSSIIDGAWDVEWGADDHLWIGDLEYVMRYNPVTEQLDSVLHKPQENVLGIEIHPDFPNTPQVFVVVDTAIYYAGSAQANVYRYEWNGTQLTNETHLFNYPHAGEHCGGRVVVTQDDKLLISTSDYWFGGDPLSGRIHRLNLDGTIPSDNPIPGISELTSGHRNPQGLMQLPTGEIYSSEHGQAWNNELNLIIPGAHYGWPAYDGNDCINPDSCNSPTYTYEPAKSISESPPSGIDFYDHPAIPEFNHSILVATLSGGVAIETHTLNVSHDSVLQVRKYLNSVPHFGRIRDVAVAPDGSVYFIGFDRQPSNAVYRVFNPNYSPNNIVDEAKGNPLTVYPNPSNGTFVVEANHQGYFTVHEMNGKLVATGELNKAMQLSSPSGIYFIRSGNSVRKLVLR